MGQGRRSGGAGNKKGPAPISRNAVPTPLGGPPAGELEAGSDNTASKDEGMAETDCAGIRKYQGDLGP